jgi:hypothetical protein
MAYVSDNYRTHPDAPMGQWVSTRTSNLGPYTSNPPVAEQGNPSYSGQCVSYCTRVCSTLPVATRAWKQGKLVKGDSTVLPGTAIATFNADGRYVGHAAIFENQTADGLNVVDQWCSGRGKAIGGRMLRFGASGRSNNGDGFYVID